VDRRERLARARLYVVTDARTRQQDLAEFLDAILEAGADIVQLREKDAEARDVMRWAEPFSEAAERQGALFIVNDRADVALAAQADGIQRTHASLSVEDLQVVADKRVRVGASVHSVAEAQAAQEAGAEWIFFGPVYDTPSKRRYGAPQGLASLTGVTRNVSIPVIAIGGITAERVAEVRHAGAAGVAVISAILASPSPADATRRFLSALDATVR
jgi:thiamine-phosphate pyrophosphorylase